MEKQKQLIADQTAELQRLSFEDLMTGMYNHNRFYRDMESGRFAQASALGVACFDINGLKGGQRPRRHLAGDEFIREAARHIIAAFPGLGYRLGGDEFLVLWEGVEEDVFRQRVKEACAQALAHGGAGGLRRLLARRPLRCPPPGGRGRPPDVPGQGAILRQARVLPQGRGVTSPPFFCVAFRPRLCYNKPQYAKNRERRAFL